MLDSYHMDDNNIFIQNKKLIAINNNNKSGWQGVTMPDSTINSGKSYLLVQVGEWTLQTTRMGMYMVGNQNN